MVDTKIIKPQTYRYATRHLSITPKSQMWVRDKEKLSKAFSHVWLVLVEFSIDKPDLYKVESQLSAGWWFVLENIRNLAYPREKSLKLIYKISKFRCKILDITRHWSIQRHTATKTINSCIFSRWKFYVVQLLFQLNKWKRTGGFYCSHGNNSNSISSTAVIRLHWLKEGVWKRWWVLLFEQNNKNNQMWGWFIVVFCIVQVPVHWQLLNKPCFEWRRGDWIVERLRCFSASVWTHSMFQVLVN